MYCLFIILIVHNLLITDHLGRDVDLTGLEVLERDQRLVRQARSDVEKQAVVMMDRGMELQNQTQVNL